MADTPRLVLPYISSSQSQKEVTHNESLNILDALLQATALDYTATPPGSPAAGNLYLVAASPTGAWSGHAQAVALYIGGTWEFHTPAEGWLCYDRTANYPRVFDGSTWVSLLTLGGYTDEQAQDAIGTILVDGTTIDLTYNDATPSITAEVINDSITYAKLQNVSAASRLLGRGSAGGAGDPEELSLGSGLTLSGTTLSADAGSGYTDEQAQDAVGAMLADTTTIDLTYTDGTPELKADVKTNSLDETHLKTSVAGAGLTGGNGTALAVQVDTTTIEINSDTLRLTAGSPSGNGGKDLRVNSGGTALEYYSSPYDVGGTFAGTPTANLVILRFPFPRQVIFPSSLTNSQGVCVTGPSAQTDFDLKKNGSSVGTMRFAASGTTASFIMASQTTFAAGDILTVVAPASLNGLADLGFSLAGTR